MTYERIDSEHTFNCDAKGCNKNYGGAGEFRAVWAEAASEGWVNAKGARDWEHYCPAHAEEVGG